MYIYIYKHYPDTFARILVSLHTDAKMILERQGSSGKALKGLRVLKGPIRRENNVLRAGTQLYRGQGSGIYKARVQG